MTNTNESFIWEKVNLKNAPVAQDVNEIYNLNSTLFPKFSPLLTLAKYRTDETGTTYTVQNFIGRNKTLVNADNVNIAKNMAIDILLLSVNKEVHRYQLMLTELRKMRNE